MGCVTALQIHVALPPGLDPQEIEYIRTQVQQAADGALRQLEEDRNKPATDFERQRQELQAIEAALDLEGQIDWKSAAPF